MGIFLFYLIFWVYKFWRINFDFIEKGAIRLIGLNIFVVRDVIFFLVYIVFDFDLIMFILIVKIRLLVSVFYFNFNVFVIGCVFVFRLIRLIVVLFFFGMVFISLDELFDYFVKLKVVFCISLVVFCCNFSVFCILFFFEVKLLI